MFQMCVYHLVIKILVFCNNNKFVVLSCVSINDLL
jgi:hypothetical protein